MGGRTTGHGISCGADKCLSGESRSLVNAIDCCRQLRDRPSWSSGVLPASARACRCPNRLSLGSQTARLESWRTSEMRIELTINKRSYTVDVPPETPLLWVLRDVIGLTGTKCGCGIAQCGACTVRVGSDAVRSCITAVGNIAKPVITIEGLDADGNHPVQHACREERVPQCGYCQAGCYSVCRSCRDLVAAPLTAEYFKPLWPSMSDPSLRRLESLGEREGRT